MVFAILQEDLDIVMDRAVSLVIPSYEIDPVQEARQKMLAAAFVEGGHLYEKLFAAMDRSKDNRVTFDELLTFCRVQLRLRDTSVSEAQILDIFESMDINKSGFVDYQELVSFVRGF